jgi:hypothetical protein
MRHEKGILPLQNNMVKQSEDNATLDFVGLKNGSRLR